MGIQNQALDASTHQGITVLDVVHIIEVDPTGIQISKVSMRTAREVKEHVLGL